MRDKNESRPRTESKNTGGAKIVKKANLSNSSSDNRRPFGDKPFGNDEKRRFSTKSGEDNRRGNDFSGNRNANDRPFSKSNKPFSADSKFEKNAPLIKKKREETPANERRVGKYEQPPRYNFDRMKDSLPQKLQLKMKAEITKVGDDMIRLNRYISNAGLCSRREADEMIASGQITVNGKVITEMGYKVKPSDVVKYGKKVLNREKFVYILLNKPKDYITTTDDPNERKTVMDLLVGACSERIYPVGRLDRNTTGLLLLTNDGELAEKLSHPSNEIRKIYQAELDKPITTEHFEAIMNGFELEDGMVKVDELALVTPDAEVVGIEIHSGKNRIVRRIFEHFGYEVTKLDRTIYAGLTKKELPRGKWRFLTEKELIRLKYFI